MKWIFTKKWPDKDKATAQIHTRKVLQFIQLKPENPHPTQWLFVGAYDVLDEYTENDGKILYRYNEIPEYASLKARAVVYYKRDRVTRESSLTCPTMKNDAGIFSRR